MPSSSNTVCSAMLISSPGWKRTGATSLPAAILQEVLRATTPSPRAAAPRRRSWRATSARPATGLCSISAIPLATRWKRPAVSRIGSFTARRQGLLRMAEAERAIRHLAEVGLPTRLRDIAGPLPSVDQLMELIAQDKKVKRGMLTFILVRGIGAAFIEAGVDAREVRVFLSEKLAEQ